MSDFLAAIGLFFAIEGIFLAAFPIAAKRAMAAALETPEEIRIGPQGQHAYSPCCRLLS